MRLPQPEHKVRVLARIAMANRVLLLRRVMPVMGNSRSASRGVVLALRWSAVVCEVLMVRVNAFGVVPGGRYAGLKDAVAKGGSPVAARVIGLANVEP